MHDNRQLILITAATGTLVWAACIVGAPLLAAVSGPLSGAAYVFGSIICHQLPDRSFHLAGVQLPVCARCTGLYLGAAVGLAAWTVSLRRRSDRQCSRGRALSLLAVAAAPTATSVVSALAGLGDPANAWRAALALPLGIAGGALVGAVASEHLK